MHKLEELIANWRKDVTSTGEVSLETVEELEIHLRESVEKLVSSGVSEAEAFRQAVEQFGEVRSIASEFGKVEERPWLPMKVAFGIGMVAVAGALILMAIKMNGPGERVLLISHILAVTIGYGATFLLGALGICFVGQRCVGEFSATRLNSVLKGSFRLSALALVFTSIGV